MSNDFNCTITDIDTLFEELNEENRNSVVLAGLKKGGERLQELTKQNLRKELGSAASSSNHWQPMERGIRLTVEKFYNEVIVSILKDFRLKFFEKGTKERYLKKDHIKSDGRKLKKGSYRGSIKAHHFFAEARNNESAIFGAMEEAMTEKLNKIIK